LVCIIPGNFFIGSAYFYADYTATAVVSIAITQVT